jgi:hypothetical protein
MRFSRKPLANHTLRRSSQVCISGARNSAQHRFRVFTPFAVLLLAVLSGCSSAPASPRTADSPLPAFPGAQGFAAYTTGGRGGAVYHVTNLNDSGAGSFRDAVNQPKRTVIFDVGGYIDLKSVVNVASDITIAGQTAPGEGIGTRNYEISFSNSRNVIVRFIRFRQGNTPGQEKKSAVNITGGNDMIFDHVSIEWGCWDTVDMNLCKNMTMQYCIIGQGVYPQRFGCLCQSANVTFTHDLWINNQSRNPKAKGTIQYVNNVVYNWGGAGGFVEGHSANDSYDDVVGNYFIAGPDSADHHAFAMGLPTDKVYSYGNFIDINLNGLLDGAAATDADLGNITVQKSPFSSLQLQIDPAAVAFEKVVAEAGCSLHRDAVDRNLIDQVKSLGKVGKIVEHVTDIIGGPQEIQKSVAAKPSPANGIPDDWKATHGSAPSPQGYTPLEVYLQSLVDSNVK